MHTHLARRPAAARRLTAFTLGLLALAGCTGEGDGKATDKPSTARPSASADTAAPTATQGADEKAPTGADRWAGTKQFVQIEKAWTNADRPHLSVRPAQKEAHPQFEAWVVTPGTGPFTAVPLAVDARVLAHVPIADERGPAQPLSPTEFVSRVMALSATERAKVGYDLSFDGSGQVIRVKSLYTP